MIGGSEGPDVVVGGSVGTTVIVVTVVMVVVGKSDVFVGDVIGGARRTTEDCPGCEVLALPELESELREESVTGVGVPVSLNHQSKHVVGDPVGSALLLDEPVHVHVGVKESGGGSIIIVGVFVFVFVFVSELELDHDAVNELGGGSTTNVGDALSVYVQVGVKELGGGSTTIVGVHVGEFDVPVSLGRIHQSIHVVGEPATSVVVYSSGRGVVVA